MKPKDAMSQSACMTDVEMSAFLRRELDGPRFLACADHIAECEACRDKLVRRQDLAAVKSQFERDIGPFVEHVPEDEIQQYVSGRLAHARIREIDRHLARCTQCAGEIRDLRNFAAEMPPAHAFFLSKSFMAVAAVVLVVVAVAFLSLRRPREVVVLNDVYGRVSLDQRGALSGTGLLTADQQQAVRQALTQQNLSFPASLQAIHEEPGTLMGAAESAPFRLLAPIGAVVRSSRPTLSWSSDPKSVSYRVTLKDQNTGEIIQSPELQTTSWTLSTDLERNHTYVWQVVSSQKQGEAVIAPQPPAPPAKFIVLDAATNSKLQQLPPSHFVRAVLYANAGLLDDANNELMELQKLNPQSPLVRNLLDQLRQVRANE
jgi:hypothetical protein